MANNQGQKPSLDRYIVIHVATSMSHTVHSHGVHISDDFLAACDEHGVYVRCTVPSGRLLLRVDPLEGFQRLGRGHRAWLGHA